MACPNLAGGLVYGAFRFQVVPSHTQVSPRTPSLSTPPKRTIWRVALSNAIAWRCLAEGASPGNLSLQLEPSHDQVSLKRAPPESTPPKRITSRRVSSNAM